MKKILITGANSYIGTSFQRWVQQWPDQYMADTIDMKDAAWRRADLSVYDAMFHVAGIAHVDVKKATKETRELYYRVNRDLAIEAAAKAKKEGVRQFIFMSSIIVYGDSGHVNRQRVIDNNTVPKPVNFYGDSKLQAELGIKPLEDDRFKVVILRPPMIYGKNSKGNYHKLSKLAGILPLFPAIQNQRSMLHIDNLCEFIRLMVDNEEHGLFFPQNREYVSTADMVKAIAKTQGRKILLTKIFNPLLISMSRFVSILNKMFGNLVYDKTISIYKDEYRIRDFYQSIELTEK